MLTMYKTDPVTHTTVMTVGIGYIVLAVLSGITGKFYVVFNALVEPFGFPVGSATDGFPWVIVALFIGWIYASAIIVATTLWRSMMPS